MTKFWQNNRLFIPIILLGIFLRFYQLETRTNFTGDQGRDFLLIRELIHQKKPTLLGPKASIGEFFFGPFYYYLLASSLLIGNFDPLSGAVLTAALDSFSLILFIYLSKRVLKNKSALVASSFYATSPLLVNISKVPLNPFVIPLFSVIFLITLTKVKEKLSTYSILLGIVSGLLFQLHFATITTTLTAIFFLSQKKHPINQLTSYIFGLVLGISPMILFDLRHEFFNFRQLLLSLQSLNNTSNVLNFSLTRLIRLFNDIFLGSSSLIAVVVLLGLTWSLTTRNVKNKTFWHASRLMLISTLLLIIALGSSFNDHYAVVIFPIMFLFVGKAIIRLPTLLATSLAAVILSFNLVFLLKPVSKGYLMPAEWNLPGIRKVAQIINQDNPPPRFQIAATLDGDTRALPYRYILESKYNMIPLGVEKYPEADTLYVVTRDSAQKAVKSSVWEISSLLDKQVVQTWQIKEDIKLHRIDKI